MCVHSAISFKQEGWADIDILKDNATRELASAALMNEALRPRTGLHKTASICALHVKADRRDRQSSAS